jgi:hypothetical protein
MYLTVKVKPSGHLAQHQHQHQLCVLQGGYVALRTALALQQPLAGVVGTSTWCEAPKEVCLNELATRLHLSCCPRLRVANQHSATVFQAAAVFAQAVMHPTSY